MGKFKEAVRHLRERFIAPPLTAIGAEEVDAQPAKVCGQLGAEGRWLVVAPLDDPLRRSDLDFYELMDTKEPQKRCYAAISSIQRHVELNRLALHKFIRVLRAVSGRSIHFPELLEYGTFGDVGLVYGEEGMMLEDTKIEVVNRPVVIFSHQAVPLASLLSFSDQGFVPTAIALAAGAGMVRALAALHRCGFVHRSVSPHSFGYQLPLNLHQLQHGIVVLDFSLCLPYPARPRRFVPFVGTPRFSSPRVDFGRECGPSDDVLSVIFVIAEMIAGRQVKTTGRLPWRAVKSMAAVGEFKLNFPRSHAFARLPREIRLLYRLMLETPGPTPLEYRPIVDLFQAAITRYASQLDRLPLFLAS